MTPDVQRVPLEMYEARNAVDIAKSRGADQYAPEIFSKAQEPDSGRKRSRKKRGQKANRLQARQTSNSRRTRVLSPHNAKTKHG